MRGYDVCFSGLHFGCCVLSLLVLLPLGLTARLREPGSILGMLSSHVNFRESAGRPPPNGSRRGGGSLDL